MLTTPAVSPLFRGNIPQSFNRGERGNNPHGNPLTTPLNDAEEDKSRSALRLLQASSFSMDIEHSFSGTYRNQDGDMVTFSSNFSASLSYEREFQILFDENTRAIREAYGLDQPEDETNVDGTGEHQESEKPDDGLLELERIMPEFTRAAPTAGRIVDFATSLLPFYLQNHGGKLTEETLDGFIDLMQPAVDTGFSQAGDIIQQAKLMNDDLSQLIQKTYDLVRQKFHDFRESMLDTLKTNKGESEQEPAGQAEQTDTGTTNFLYSETSASYEESRSTTLFMA